MKTITTSELVTVTGGTSKANDAVTTQLTALQGSIKDLASAQNKPAGNDSMTTMMMMMAMRPQPSQAVVAAPAAPSPVINVDTRVRR
ncbi:MAG: hypothetical protein IPQ07_27655 [Myxococcales bacterium]|nr:hypothetical protein [Myxococcales bacterium]